MKVMKFGGISVKDASAIRAFADILKKDPEKKIVVVSAFFGITDLLRKLTDLVRKNDSSGALEQVNIIENVTLKIIDDLQICKVSKGFSKEKLFELRQLIPALTLLGETTPRSIDTILSFGERISSFVIADYLNSSGLRTAFLDASLVISTDSNHTNATVQMERTEELITKTVFPLLEKNDCIITAGFIGKDGNGAITTLGKGGSDYSASVFATCSKAGVLEIWKEVDGIMTTDPRIVPEALPVRSLSYAEASELAYFGAKVLHPKTIRTTVMAGIPVIVKKTSDPAFQGTEINHKPAETGRVKAIAFQKDVTVINICSEKMLGTYGFLSRVFDIFTKFKTPVDLITTSEINISVTVENNGHIDEIVEELSSFAAVTVSGRIAIISLVGAGIKFAPGIAARCFGTLDKVNVLMVSMGASDANLSILVDQSEMESSVKLLHKEFFEKRI